MVYKGIPIIVMTTVVLALASAAQVNVGPEGGPMKFGPGPERPFGPAQPPAVLREYAEVLRAHAREAQGLADRLHREADGLDRLAGAPFGPGMGPQEMGPGQREMMEMKGQIERLRDEAAKAKGEGRFDESQRIWDEAQNLETRMIREREVRRMAENVAAMKQKAAMVRQEAVQAKQDGRHDEARELLEKAEQIERDMQGGLEKIERFKIDSQIKDRQMMIGRAKKRSDVKKMQAVPSKVRPAKDGVKLPPKGSPQDDDLTRAVEELKGEIKQLRQELEAMKARSGESKPM